MKLTDGDAIFFNDIVLCECFYILTVIKTPKIFNSSVIVDQSINRGEMVYM